MDQQQIESLVEQFSASELPRRVDAERQLRELGPDVLEHLPDPRRLKPSAAAAIRRVRAHLQQEQAREALEPSRMTLVDETSLATAVAAIADQTGNRIDVEELPATTRNHQVTIDVKDATFWSALEAITAQADVVAVPGEDRGSVVLRLRGDIEHFPRQVTTSGPFRVALLRVGERVDFTTPGRRLLRIVLQLLPEPRLNALFVHVEDKSLSAVIADSDESLPPLSPTAQREIPVDRPGPILLSYDVVVPGGYEAERPEAVDIQGQFEVELAAGRERFTFRNLDENERVVRRHGGVSVVLEDVQRGSDELVVTLRLTYDVDGPRFESHRNWVYHNQVALQLGDDRRLRPAEFETVSEGAGGAELRYRFDDLGVLASAAAVIYTAPTLFTRVPVEFAFEDVAVDE